MLLGPNGAGKTTAGRLLERRLGWPFLSCEEVFLGLFPTLDDYYGRRDEAYAAFEARVRALLAASRRPVVIEEVGLSPPAQLLLDRLRNDYPARFVKLLADPERCAARVAARGTARNYPKDADFVRATWRRFDEGAGRYDFDLTLRTDQLSEEALLAAFAAWAPAGQ